MMPTQHNLTSICDTAHSYREVSFVMRTIRNSNLNRDWGPKERKRELNARFDVSLTALSRKHNEVVPY